MCEKDKLSDVREPWDKDAPWPRLQADCKLRPGTRYFSGNEWRGVEAPDADGVLVR